MNGKESVTVETLLSHQVCTAFHFKKSLFNNVAIIHYFHTFMQRGGAATAVGDTHPTAKHSCIYHLNY